MEKTQAKGENPEHHEKRARFYAESKGWEVEEVCYLEAVSGKSVMGLNEEYLLRGIWCPNSVYKRAKMALNDPRESKTETMKKP
jgi:hypothetical protein